jgi:uncharacterized protein YjiK
MKAFALALLCTPLVACQPTSTSTAGPEAERLHAPYDFAQPEARFDLGEDLREISALTVLDGEHLGAVQDEEGALYVIRIATGEVADVVPFGPPGDYEGVELAGERLFALRSDGVLFEIGGWRGGAQAAAVLHATGLHEDCDAEGLGYDALRARLLVACKEDGGPGAGNRKAVYAFDLATDALAPEPAFVIDRDALPEVSGKKTRKMKPSALAVHPVTGEVFTLSSKHDVLVSLGQGGQVSQAWSLKAAGFEQPEGLAFSLSGDLFVASEGDKRAPALARFSYKAGGAR